MRGVSGSSLGLELRPDGAVSVSSGGDSGGRPPGALGGYVRVTRARLREGRCQLEDGVTGGEKFILINIIPT